MPQFFVNLTVSIIFSLTIASESYANLVDQKDQDTNKTNTTLVVGGSGPGLQLPLLAVSTDRAKNWRFKSLSHIMQAGWVNSVSCAEEKLCVAIIYEFLPYKDDKLHVLRSTNGGLDWKELSQPLPFSSLSRINCTGSGSKAICIAEGYDENQQSYLVSSRDGGATWKRAELPCYSFWPASCTGTGDNAVCIALDNDRNYIAVTNDGAKTWSFHIPQGIKGNFTSASCSGEGKNAVCAVVGYSDNNSGYFLLLSTDGGEYFELQHASDFHGGLVRCIGSDADSMCIIGSAQPLQMIVTYDRGKHWQTKKIHHPANEQIDLNSMSCSGKARDVICVAVGRSVVDFNHANILLLVSKDRGNTWEFKHLPEIPNNYELVNVKCVGSGKKTTCVAGGGFNPNDTKPYLLISSRDGGTTWEINNIPDRPLCPNRPGNVCSTIYHIAAS